LLEELAVLLTYMIDYCKKHNIPIEREETLKQLMTLTRKTMQEIYKEPKPFWFNSRPEDPTEPELISFK